MTGIPRTLRLLPLLSALLSLPTQAAPAWDAPIAFSAAQMQSLGIALAKPLAASQAAGVNLSARVIAAPDAEWVVTAAASGVVVRLPVTEGDTVAAGASLVELRSADAPKLGAGLMQAESAARLARSELERDRQLHADGIIAARRLQASEQAAAQADAALAAARMQLKLMGMSAQEAGSGRVIARAPAAATVLERLVTPGQRVNEADPLLRLVDAGKLMLELQLPVDEATLAVGDTLTLPDGRRATVKQAGWGASEGAQTVRVRASLPAGSTGLRPGQWLKVQRALPASSGWRIPAAAISREEREALVFEQTADGFRAVPVRVLGIDGDSATVSGALSAERSVAASGTVAIKGAWLGHGGGN